MVLVFLTPLLVVFIESQNLHLKGLPRAIQITSTGRMGGLVYKGVDFTTFTYDRY